MSEMVEQVARALCEACGHNPNRRFEEYGQSSYAYWEWELFVDEARAMIDKIHQGAQERV